MPNNSKRVVLQFERKDQKDVTFYGAPVILDRLERQEPRELPDFFFELMDEYESAGYRLKAND